MKHESLLPLILGDFKRGPLADGFQISDLVPMCQIIHARLVQESIEDIRAIHEFEMFSKYTLDILMHIVTSGLVPLIGPASMATVSDFIQSDTFLCILYSMREFHERVVKMLLKDTQCYILFCNSVSKIDKLVRDIIKGMPR